MQNLQTPQGHFKAGKRFFVKPFTSFLEGRS